VYLEIKLYLHIVLVVDFPTVQYTIYAVSRTMELFLSNVIAPSNLLYCLYTVLLLIIASSPTRLH
jgi:hypothetical protein